MHCNSIVQGCIHNKCIPNSNGALVEVTVHVSNHVHVN